MQLLEKAPPAVWDLFDAAWNRATPWCMLLADACRQFLPAVRDNNRARVPYCTIAAMSQLRPAFVKAARFLSRWGSAQVACCDLWKDVALPREKRVLGVMQPCTCPLCQAVLPSQHALAAHVHRKHSVVNCYTKLTNGTVCFWCNTEMHSTDRLKYHLRTTPSCLRGLRVQVGEVYAYGTGTKRTGRRRHTGLPAIRLPGPRNATPAQRQAALEGRQCTQDELDAELLRVTGAAHVHDWPQLSPQAPAHMPPASPVASRPRVSDPAPSGEAIPLECIRWFTVVPTSQAAQADTDGVTCLSPLWSYLTRVPAIWRLPQAWHQYWSLWSALEANAPWDLQHKRDFAPLRRALTSSPRPDGPSWEVLDLVSATVTFRQVCTCVKAGGALWLQGRPSNTGLRLLRSLLPEADMFTESTTSGTVFVAANTALPSIPGLDLYVAFAMSMHGLLSLLCSRLGPRTCIAPCRWVGASRFVCPFSPGHTLLPFPLFNLASRA